MMSKVMLDILAEHWLVNLGWNHNTPMCACARVRLGTYPTLGQAVRAWARHAAEMVRAADAH